MIAFAYESHTAPVPPARDPRELEALGDEIARLAAHIHAATHRLLVLVAEFDRRGGWGGGFTSCAHWLSWRTGVAPGAAREKVRVARALESLPALSAAMARGELSYSKVRALTRVATPENEGDLLQVARHASAAHVERLVRVWRRVDRIESRWNEEMRHQGRFLRLQVGEDGMWDLRARLDPEVGALLEKALEWAAWALYKKERGEESNPEAAPDPANQSQRRADALGLVAERALASAEGMVDGADDGAVVSRAERFQVVLHVEGAALASDEADAAGAHPVARAASDRSTPRPACPPSAPDVSAETRAAPRDLCVLPWLAAREPVGLPLPATARRLACDASLVPMVHAPDGEILSVGRSRRTVPPALRRALEHRDGGCRFPGCGNRFADAHHIVHWADGGETKLRNLVLLCRRHHRAVHEEGYAVERTPDGEVRFLRPDGRPLPLVPDAPPLPTDPPAMLVGEQEAMGVHPDEWTPTPDWHGEPLDYGLALDMLRRVSAETWPRPAGATRSAGGG